MGNTSKKIEPGIYLHYKGRKYEVLGEGIHTETGEAGVFYRAFDDHPEGKYEKGDYFFRPRKIFIDTVVIEGEEVPRFRLVIRKNNPLAKNSRP